MGENENWHEPGELLPNGLLPGAGPGPAMQALDRERWWRAEGRTAELLACIKPNPLAEVRRNAVADYVRLLIMKCFPCQVFTFGSVPLKTYLPDGDIDLTVFAPDQNMKDRWANLVCEKLESEEKNENAKFRVKEVQFIQAEVKIIKCLVENIVVDISFNQVGGLCTLCFLEEVDNLISQSYLFKQSIILVKAWCYYESRILGAHHGLISTYALETLVLYIFHVFNNSFQGPLEVLFRFLEFFSKFDWDNFCVSLWGPVPITTLPDIAADPPLKDSGELLLSKSFLDGCSLAYAVFPGGLENNAQPFISKHFNVIDPLRVNNNLGRSVSKGNFFRIRSAFAFGAKRLARLLDCPDENLISEVNQFFTNTWERHGSGRRPDTAGGDILHERLSTLDARHDFGKSDDIGENNVNQKSVVLEKEDRGIHGHGVSSQHGGISAKMMPITSELSAAPHVENLKSQNLKTLWVTDQMGSRNISGPVLHSHGIQTDSKAVHLVNDTQGRFFARTHSSPELTDAYGDVSSQSWRSRQTEASYANGSYSKTNTSNRKQNHGSDSLGRLVNHSSVEDASSRSLDAAANDSRCVLNSHHKDLGSDDFCAEFSSNSEALGTTLQENQDIVNKMASASLQSFDGPFHIPFNLNPAHIPFSIQPSFLASMGYTHQNMSGFGPTNIPLINEPCPNVKSPHGLVSEQLTPCFHGFGVDLPSETPFERSSENFDPVAKNLKDQDACSSRGCDPENGKFSDGLHSDSRPPPALMPGSKYVPPSRAITSDNSMRVHPKHTKGKHGSVQQSIENFPIPEERSTSSRFSSSMHLSSLRSKTSDFSWDGSPTKSSTEKWARKMASVDQASTHGKGKIMSEPVLNNWIDDNEKKCVIMPKMGTEMMIERQPEPESVVSFQVPGHHMPGLEAVQTNVMDSMIPLNPMLIDPGLRQRINDNSGLVPFYPAGPPIPFLTMLYNVPSEKGNSDLSRGDCEGDATLKNSESIHGPLQYNYSENLNTSNSWRESSAAKISERKIPDILHGDFASHWQNLQFARFCQDPQCHGPLLHPSPVMVPPAYLQGQFPYENPGRLLLTNANIFSQLMTSYGHHLAPVAPIQSVSGRPPNMYQHYTEEMGRSRTGTGTYLPNPVSVRERHSTGDRRGNYNHDQDGDGEGNWNANSKSLSAGQIYRRNQIDRLNPRSERLTCAEGLPGNTYRHEPVPTYYSQNELNSTSNFDGPQNVPYGLFPIASMNAIGFSNEPSVPPVVVLYPFDHNSAYGFHGEQPEFGSL